MNKSLLLGLGLSLMLTACQSSTAGGEGGTPQPTTGPTTLKVNWHHDQPEWRMIGYSTLLGDLFMKPGKVKAFNIHTQKMVFEAPITTQSSLSSYAAVGENIFVMDIDGRFSILSRDGKVLNTVDTGNRQVTIRNQGPYVTETGVYFALGKTVYKYNLSDLLKPDAKPAWTWEKESNGHGAFMSFQVLSDDEFLVATRFADYNHLISLRGDRTERWNIDLFLNKDTAQDSSFIIEPYGNTVVAHVPGQGLQAYDRATGKATWATYPDPEDHCAGGGTGSATNATIADDKIFIAPFGNKCVMAFDAKTGNFLWSFNSPYYSSFSNKVVYLNDVIYATNGRLWALDADTGKLLATSDEDLKPNYGTPLAYDPVQNQLVSWGGTGIYSFQPLK